MALATAYSQFSMPSRTLQLDRPARVLHVIHEFSGGMERSMIRLIERSRLLDGQEIGSSGIMHGICVLNEVQRDLSGYCPTEVPLWTCGSVGYGHLYRRWQMLRKVARGFKPDIVHARGSEAWVIAAAAIQGLKDTRLLLSDHHPHTYGSQRRHLSVISRMAQHWAAQQSSTVLTVSSDAAAFLHRELAVPSDKLVTIPNGVDTSLFCPAEDNDELSGIRNSLQVSPNADVAICVADLLPVKNIELLIRAWRQVVMADPLAHLLLIGDGPLRGTLESLVEQSRCARFIHFLGRREDVPTLLQAADVFVLPSKYEPCSDATLEAMAVGLPIIACDINRMSDLVMPHRTGWLIPCDDQEALTRTLLATLLDRNVRRRVGAAARDTMVKHFGLDTWVARHTALYRRLAGLRPARLVSREEDTVCAE